MVCTQNVIVQPIYRVENNSSIMMIIDVSRTVGNVTMVIMMPNIKLPLSAVSD